MTMRSRNTNREIKPLYVVNGLSNRISDLPPETLTAALRSPLAEIGVAVEARPKDFTGGGLRGYGFDGNVYRAVEEVVIRVVGSSTRRACR